MAKQLAIRLAAIIGSATAGVEGHRVKSYHVSGAQGELSPFRVVSNEAMLRFGPNHVIDDILCIMRIEAIIPGVHTRNISHEYFSDHHEGAVEIVPQFGCEALGEQIVEDGIAHMVLRIPRSLEAGESHVFMFRIKIHSKVPAHPSVATMAPVSDMDQHTSRIQFHQDAIPVRVWKFSLPSHYEVRCAKYREQTPVLHGGSRFVSEQWKGLKTGRSYGIAWDWADDDCVLPMDKKLG